VSARDLLNDPAWQGSDLGHPLPDRPHAVSVALPRWQDVIAYEENEPECRTALQTIYPRFGFHPLLQQVTAATSETGSTLWPYPSTAAASEAQTHCNRKAPEAHTRIIDVEELPCLQADAEATPHAKAFWQHTGLGASSRVAAIALGREQRPSAEEGNMARLTIRERLAAIHRTSSSRISLHPAGMAALHSALSAVQSLRPGRTTLQLGFPYVDVFKQPKVVFHGGDLVMGDDLSEVEAALDRLEPGAVIVELPSNPLLRCVDLPAIAELTRHRGIPVIADDTIGTAFNLEALDHTDLLFTSLTKSFAGRGDVMAGSLLVSPSSPWSDQLMAALNPAAELSDPDAIALEQASRDVAERVPQLDRNCLALADQLQQHPAVERVLHPRHCLNYKALMRTGAGYGCLLSFVLKEGEPKAQRVYDALRVSKGPSLGTNFTLVCPYTQLAHYNELPWAERCGVPSHLLRVSVGLENPSELWERFELALDA